MINVNVLERGRFQADGAGQNGFALIVVIAVLFLITVGVMVAFNTSDTDRKIAANSLDKGRAFYASEAGVIEAMSFIKANRSFNSGSLANKTLPNGAKFNVTWDSLRAVDNSIRMVSTGDAINPGAQTQIETRVEVSDNNLDEVVTVPKMPGFPGAGVPFRSLINNANIYGKVFVGADPWSGQQVTIATPNPAQIAGAASLMISGNEYNVKVNNPVGDGVANQFTVTVAGVPYNGTVTWDNPANPVNGTASVVIGGVTYTGTAKPGTINMTAASTAYSGPLPPSGKVGFLNYSQPQEPPPAITAPDITALGVKGAVAGGYPPPAGLVDFAKPGDADLYLTINGVSTKVYDKNTNTIDFTVIPSGILYLPAGVSFGTSGGQTTYYKGVGTIVAGSTGELKIAGSLIPAPGLAASSDLALACNGQVNVEPPAAGLTVMANAYVPGLVSANPAFQMKDDVTWIGSIVTANLELEGDGNANGLRPTLIYRHPKHALPGIAYFGGNLKVFVQQGSWVEK